MVIRTSVIDGDGHVVAVVVQTDSELGDLEQPAQQHATQFMFTADDVLGRVDEHGDLLADLDDTRALLPG